MSFAINAAPFEQVIQKKKIRKNFSNKLCNSNEMANKIKTIQSDKRNVREQPLQGTDDDVMTTFDDDDDSSLVDFRPINPPVSAGVEKTKNNDTDGNVNFVSLYDGSGVKNADDSERTFDSNPFLSHDCVSDASRVSYTKTSSKEALTTSSNNNSNIKKVDEIEVKLNYLIKLMEKDKEQNTQYIAEEIMLYSFLGIFVIYVVDSFTRVGKYVR